MKTQKLLFFLPVFLMLVYLPLPAQYTDWNDYEQSDALTAFDRYLQDAASAIGAADVRQAIDRLELAKTDASVRKDKSLKRKAQDAKRRVKALYAPCFEYLEAGRRAFTEREWKEAQLAFEAAQEIVQELHEQAFPEFASVDRALATEVQQDLGQAVRQRQYLVQERLRRAEQLYRNDAYDAAMQEAGTARTLLIAEREQRQYDRLEELENRIRFGQKLSLGDRAMQEQQFELALNHYEEALQYSDSEKVNRKIDELKRRLHYQLLQEGQDAFFAGAYGSAADKLSAAAEFYESDYLHRVRENSYQRLRQRGQVALDQGDHETSTQLFREASRFLENDAINSDIKRAKTYKKYEKHLQKALASLQEGNLKRARRQFARAGKYQQTPLVKENIAAIDQYHDKLAAGKRQLPSNPSKAWKSFQQAQKLYNTPEVREYLQKAESAAGGVVGAESGEAFYN